MTSLPASDAAYALFHEIAAWIDDVTAGVRDFDDFADTVAGRLIPVADAARDEARAMGEKVARVEALHHGWHVCVNKDGAGSTDYSSQDDDDLDPCPTAAALASPAPTNGGDER